MFLSLYQFEKNYKFYNLTITSINQLQILTLLFFRINKEERHCEKRSDDGLRIYEIPALAFNSVFANLWPYCRDP